MQRVLIVEDVYTVRLKLELVLRNAASFIVCSASSGIEALMLVEETPPHAIVMDVVMADMDGIATLRMLRAHGVTCPVIAYTARNERQPGEFVDYGFDAYVSKAESLSKLIAMLQNVMQESRRTLQPPIATSFSSATCVPV